MTTSAVQPAIYQSSVSGVDFDSFGVIVTNCTVAPFIGVDGHRFGVGACLVEPGHSSFDSYRGSVIFFNDPFCNLVRGWRAVKLMQSLSWFSSETVRGVSQLASGHLSLETSKAVKRQLQSSLDLRGAEVVMGQAPDWRFVLEAVNNLLGFGVVVCPGELKRELSSEDWQRVAPHLKPIS